jgi:hypothetical protein
MHHRTSIFCLPLALLAACATGDENTASDPLNRDALAADEEEASPTSPEDSLRGASLERPCAERTITQVQVRNSNRMSFCVLGVAKTIFIEVGLEDIGSMFDEVGIRDPFAYCAVDLYMAVTEDSQPLPVELLDACPRELRRRDDYARREPVRGGYFETIREPQAANFCGSDGKSKFKAACPVCNAYDDCLLFCDGDPVGMHQRTLSIWLGEEGNIALDKNASCNGSTRVRGWDREDEGDAWGPPDYDFSVTSGHSSSTGFIYHSGFAGQDYDFKLRGDSRAGAFHRFGTYLEDE